MAMPASTSTPRSTRSFTDYVQPFQIEAAGVRGRLVRLGASVDAVMAGHGYPPAVATLLAETIALTAVLASGLKYDGVFTLQIHGNGPVGLVLADLTSDGALRGYARFDNTLVEAVDPSTDALIPRLLGAGHMAFTVDQGPETERYQGITSLEGSTLTDCAHTYFRQSEQLDTAIVLCASDMATPHCQRRAAALMIQRLPPAGLVNVQADDDWRRAVILMSSVSVAEMLDPALEPDRLLYRLFHEDGVRIFRQRPLYHQCRCSRTRVERTLKAFPRVEIEDMAEDGIIRVTCEFCKTEYVLDEQARDRLFG